MDFTAFRANLSGMIKGHGLSIRGLALEVGITPATLSRYLNGTRTPDLPYIAKLAHYFNVGDSQKVCWSLRKSDKTG